MIFSKSLAFDEGDIGDAGVTVTIADETNFIDRLRSGEEAAFDTLVERYSGGIYGLLYRLTDNAEESNDLLQETFIRAFRSISGFRGDSGLKTWLYRIAINESRNRHRWWKRRRRDVTLSLDATIAGTESTFAELLSGDDEDPEKSTLRREREQRLRDAIAELPVAYRESLILADIEGLTYEETAQVTGASLGTVKSRIARGRQALRESLKDI